MEQFDSNFPHKTCCRCQRVNGDVLELRPCHCFYCKDCWIQHLYTYAISSTENPPRLSCGNCQRVVLSHICGSQAIHVGNNTSSKVSPFAAAAAAASNPLSQKTKLPVSTNINTAKDPNIQKLKPSPKRPKNTSTPKKTPVKRLRLVGAFCQNDFDNGLPLLKQFFEENGHCQVPSEGYPDLSAWMKRIRARDERRSLSAQQLDELRKYGYKAVKRSKTFEDRLAELNEFKANHGHLRVTYGYAGNPSLGEWVKNTRGGKTKLTPEQRQTLNQIGFVWETGYNRFDREWKEQYQLVENFYRENGHCRVREKEQRKLYEWCHTQRKQLSKNKLREDRKELLNAIGFFDPARRVGRSNGLKDEQKEPSNQAIHVPFEALPYYPTWKKV